MVDVLIRDARPEDLDEVRALFTEYATEAGIDLEFQGFTAELAGLPGKYAAPGGAILLGCDQDGRVLGVVAVRPLEAGVCEMKRLFVRPQARGTGLSRRLATAIMDRARDLGYSLMRLDTLESMAPALRLYLALGFRRVAAYYPNPLPDVVYLEREL